jgi:small-conductance mechanosensitive channel
MAAAVLLTAFVLLVPAAAEQGSDSDPAGFEAIRLLLERVEGTLKREGLSAQTLYDLGRTLNPARDELHGRIADLEPKFAQIEERLKKLGPPPAKDAPPENPALAEERARLNQELSEIEAPLKQARSLAARADQISEQITEKRRDAYARQLFEQSPSVLSPSLWLDSAHALRGEIGDLVYELRAWADLLRAPENLSRTGVAMLASLAICVAVFLLRRWLWRHGAGAPGTPTRFGKAVAALGVILRIMLVAPLMTVAIIAVLETLQLLPHHLIELAHGLAAAVAIAAGGRAVATGVLAPEAPERRLIALDDATVRVLMRALVWSARAMGLLVLSLVVHKMLTAPPVLLITTNMAFALVVCGLLAQLLWASYRPRAQVDTETLPRALWIRALGWLALTVMVLALLSGYSGFATFIAERMLSTLAVLGMLYLLLILTHTLFIERLGAGTARGRAIAANFGVSPRRLGLIASLVSGGICLFLILGALILIVGPWEVSAGDFLDTLKGFAFGFRIGEVTISFGAILAAAFWLLLALLITKALQKWLERYLLPRTEMEPSLQQSIGAIAGYIGVIVAIVLALTQLGIDLQKVALIAGALSVGIGFGLQSIVSNFVSGLILLAERPIRIGDLVVVKGEEGYVRRIRVRATEIETFDRASVIIPNAEFITGAVKNWTHANTTGRIIIKVKLPYRNDPELVCETLLASANEHPRVLKQPPPRALLLGFGDTALEFELRVFIGHVDDGLVTRSDLHLDILRRFRAAGIAMTPPPPPPPVILTRPAPDPDEERPPKR